MDTRDMHLLAYYMMVADVLGITGTRSSATAMLGPNTYCVKAIKQIIFPERPWWHINGSVIFVIIGLDKGFVACLGIKPAPKQISSCYQFTSQEMALSTSIWFFLTYKFPKIWFI